MELGLVSSFNQSINWHLHTTFKFSMISEIKISKRTCFSSQLLSNGSWMTGFCSCHKTEKKCKCFSVGRCPWSKVYNLVSVYPKSIKLGQVTALNMIFHLLVSVYRSVKIGSLRNFGIAFFAHNFWRMRRPFSSRATTSVSSETGHLCAKWNYERQ